jgi:hypothetical protein
MKHWFKSKPRVRWYTDREANLFRRVIIANAIANVREKFQ